MIVFLFRRLICRRRFLFLLLISLAVVFVYGLSSAHTGAIDGAYVTSAESLTVAMGFILPLIAGLAAADVFVITETSGLAWLIMSRAGNRLWYVLSTAVAGMITAAVTVFIIYLLRVIPARLAFPAHTGSDVQELLVFIPELFKTYPLIAYGLLCFVHMLAAATFALIGMVCSLVHPHPVLAVLSPFAAYYCGGLLIHNKFSPPNLVYLLSDYVSLMEAFSYWVLFSAVCLAVLVSIGCRRDLIERRNEL